jgi:hypothetical protein
MDEKNHHENENFDARIFPSSQSKMESWINSGYEIPRNIMDKDYLKVV